MVFLYNTLTRKKEEFKPILNGKVGIYSCGPTVYWHQHIGNLRTYIFADLLRRVMEYAGLEVKQVINITDVGHLTSDADDGEDKLEKASKKEGRSAKEIAEFYFDEFHKDLKKLNLLEPHVWPKATEHISEQIDLILSLEKRGYTYKTSDGIYFDTSKFGEYGKLSNKKAEDLEGGKRVSLGDKKNKTDFALWKFSSPEEKRQQEWKSPWGIGFPGWHIECSAMSSKYLGKQFDIHTGGEDHMHIHHENEIAQSECGFGVNPFVNYWMHGAFLNIPEGKMSKSTGKIERLKDLEDSGISPLAYKYFTYTAHYRKPLTWSKEAIDSAVNSYNRLKEIILKIEDDQKKENKNYLKEFEEKINDDLDMPGAIAVLWKIIRDEKATGKIATIKKMDEVFALKLLEKEKIEIPKEIEDLARKREEARKKKDWKESDVLREKIKSLGWNLKDEKTGYSLQKI